MEMILTGIENKNEYYTNHYFSSIFQENAEDTIKKWKEKEKNEDIKLPWKKLRDIGKQYYAIRDRYLRSKNEEISKPLVQELAFLYLDALGYESVNSVTQEVADGLSVPIFHEETKANGAPLLWAFLSVSIDRDDDILQGEIFERSDDEDESGTSIGITNDDVLSKLFFAGEEAPRFILLIGINQIALIDRNKWNEKRYLQFLMDDIFSRHEESTFMAMTVLLHKESLCPHDGSIVLDSLDENSHKHSAGVSDALKYALRECIEILGNEVIYDMKTRQGINLDEHPVDASELTLECLRYMYRFLFMLFIEARPELGYAPMKSQTYVQGYSLEGLRDVCDMVKDESESLSEGYYIDDTLKKLFHMTYFGYPENLEEYKKALEIEKKSMHDAFTIEALKAHIFDPEYTKMITRARLRNSAMLKIVDLMSISRPANSKERKGRISYSALGINQMGAVYEALLSYRGFIAEDNLYEVKRAGDKFNELDVGYFVKENELENYDEKTERVRYESGDKKGQLRMYEKGTFIYRLAGREREKSASYYTPEVLTKCLVKYSLKELLKDKTADEILHLTVCEPAMGSAAFLNETINQLAEAYLNKKQEELGETISFDRRFEELQKVKMYIADRNVYGCDLNPVAVELAEVSLWLNTIYKGAYVPWFGTQLVNGNSLIGARRQVYSQSLLENGKWYEKAPRRILPGEVRTRKGQHETTKEIYHFLLGDPGMSNYTDKVVKNLESENIKKIKEWNKEFTQKFDEEDIKTALRLSESIDDLWKKAVDTKRKVKVATYEPLSVYGHDEIGEGSHKTIREKDAIYKKLYKSEDAQNAGPYARLKAAMDYWCALWFWPIDKADLLPTRQIFFFEMSLILEGNVRPVASGSIGQMKMQFDDSNNISLTVEGTQLELQFKEQYKDLGIVCLDDLRKRSERLSIVNKIAREQKFQHWELEFSDLFDNRGGFDLVIGNPPWVKLEWNEFGVLSEKNPIFSVKHMKANIVAVKREQELESTTIRKIYLDEYCSISGQQNFIGAKVNYPYISGAVNLYKEFLPLAWEYGVSNGVSAYVHPEGVFDDPKGGTLRNELYSRLRMHFQFENELGLFQGTNDHGRMRFSLNVYNNHRSDSFDAIANIFSPKTIDMCYEELDDSEIPGIKDSNGNWSIIGHKDRIIHVGKEELKLFANLFDGGGKWEQARFPSIHAQPLLDVLECFSKQTENIYSDENSVFTTEMWNETGAQNDGTIKRNVHFPKEDIDTIISGPHIWIANPKFKTSREVCVFNGDYDNLDYMYMDDSYRARCNYSINCELDKYYERIPKTPWKSKYTDEYRLVMRKMIGLSGERSLIPAIIPPKVGHIDGLFGVASLNKLPFFAACFSSLPYDYLIKASGKSNCRYDLMSKILLPHDDERVGEIECIILQLNCVDSRYDKLWNKYYKQSFNDRRWTKNDHRLDNKKYLNMTGQWNRNYILFSDFERRQALVELDVLVAQMLGMTLEQLVTIYRIQFPVLKAYEDDTWYDYGGRIVFSAKNMGELIFKRPEWETQIKNTRSGVVERKYYDSTCGDPIERTIRYVAPFDKCDRKNDYEIAWDYYLKKYRRKVGE